MSARPIITLDTTGIIARLDHGKKWTRGSWGDPANPDAATCLHGAVRYCQPSDAPIIEHVGARFGFGVRDNDNAPNWRAVERMIVEHPVITDEMLADTFGPQWEPIVALVQCAARLNADEVKALDAARAAAGAAAWALVVRDLIGQHGFTQAHYDLLTRPWATVIGPVHPDDKPVQS